MYQGSLRKDSQSRLSQVKGSGHLLQNVSVHNKAIRTRQWFPKNTLGTNLVVRNTLGQTQREILKKTLTGKDMATLQQRRAGNKRKGRGRINKHGGGETTRHR